MKQVLIVDDEFRLLQSIEAGLKKFKDKFQVITAANGKEAVEVLQEEHVDLLVTDLRMPEMDGFELVAHMTATFPFTPIIVMTAFATPEIEEKLNQAGTSKLLEKPIDFNKLAESIIDGLEQEGKEGSVAGFSLVNFLQLLGMEQKTCLLNVKDDEMDGYIYLDEGEIVAAVSGAFKGEDALFLLLACENVRITFKKLPKKKVVRMIDQPLMSLLLEGMRRVDESRALSDETDKTTAEEGQSPVAEKVEGEVQVSKLDNKIPDEDNGKPYIVVHQPIKGELEMGKLEETLGRLGEVEGFMAVGVFTPNGEMAAQVNSSGMKLAEIGSMANDVLLKAQKATKVMNVGRGHLVHIEAPSAHIIARCHNESDKFDDNEAGKAHIHMVMLINKDGNLAMAKIKMESVIGEVAAAFR